MILFPQSIQRQWLASGQGGTSSSHLVELSILIIMTLIDITVSMF